MTFYWYTFRLRPLDFGTQPEPFFTTEPAYITKEGYRFGAVCYTEPLTEEQVEYFELEEIDPPRDVEEWEIRRSNQRRDEI